MTMTQDFELPAIKVNNDKIEVITTVSKPETDLSMKLTEISDKFERAFSNQHSQVAIIIARLEKIEGKSSSLNFLNDSIPQIDSQGVLQTSLSAASGISIETLVHGMPTDFYIGQPSLSEMTPVRPPPMAGLTAPSGKMMGVTWNPPLVNKVDLLAARQSQLAAIDELNKFKEQVASMVKNKFGIDMGNSRLYQKPYKADFDLMAYPPGWHVPDFIKFSSEDNRTTWEHISQYIAQLGEASAHDSFKVRLFSLSLTGTAFAWFSSSTPNSIDSWNHLEQKFHDHFFSGDYQLKLTDLTSVKQGKDETVSNYLKRFKEVKNRCFNLSDLANLAAKGLKSALRERLEGVDFYSLDSVLVRGMPQELKLNKEKEKLESHRSDVNVVDYVSNNLNDKTEIYSVEFVWPS
jgi:hypothetical protein